MQLVTHRLTVYKNKIFFVFFLKKNFLSLGSYEDISGTWNFYEGPRTFDKNYDCSTFSNFTTYFKVKLLFPNTAIDEDGNVGYWTMIYNQVFYKKKRKKFNSKKKGF